MMRYLVIMSLILIFFIGCSEESDISCDDYECGEFSSCKIVNDEATCLCNDHYIKNSENICIPSCDGIYCDQHLKRHCDIIDQIPVCVCNDHYREESGACLASCSDFNCGDINMVCMINDQNNHQCICKTGYEKVSGFCKKITVDLCIDFDCSHLKDSFCRVENEIAKCVCEDGFVKDGDGCIDPRVKQVRDNFNRVVEYVRSELISGYTGHLDITDDVVFDLNQELGKSPFGSDYNAVGHGPFAGSNGVINVDITDLRTVPLWGSVVVQAPYEAPYQVDGVEFGLSDVVVEKCDQVCAITRKEQVVSNFNRAVEYVQSELDRAPARDPSITNDAVLDLNDELGMAPFDETSYAIMLAISGGLNGVINISSTDLRRIKSGETVTIFAPESVVNIDFDLKDVTITQK